jgi:Cu2+-containing amine oxidase
MFVPYASSSPRFWDVSYNFSLVTLNKEAAGPFGQLLGEPPVVAKEVRDRGVMWVDTATGVRRGQKLLLWSCLDAANYRYLIEYGFQDDGVITFRVGSTGRNYSSREFEGHMHNGLWRVNMALGGHGNNSVYVMEHFEDKQGAGKASNVMRPFNKGVEGFED